MRFLIAAFLTFCLPTASWALPRQNKLPSFPASRPAAKMESPTPTHPTLEKIFLDEQKSSKDMIRISTREVPRLIKMVNRAKRGKATKKDLRYALQLQRRYRIVCRKGLKVPYLKLIQVILRQQEKQVRQHMVNLLRLGALAAIVSKFSPDAQDKDIINMIKASKNRYERAKALAKELHDYAKSL